MNLIPEQRLHEDGALPLPLPASLRRPVSALAQLLPDGEHAPRPAARAALRQKGQVTPRRLAPLYQKVQEMPEITG